MITIIKTFHQYSGQKCNLKKADLKELINNEMNNFIVVRYLLQSGCVYDNNNKHASICWHAAQCVFK